MGDHIVVDLPHGDRDNHGLLLAEEPGDLLLRTGGEARAPEKSIQRME